MHRAERVCPHQTHASTSLSPGFCSTASPLSAINLPVWLHEQPMKPLFHQPALSCAVTLSDNRLLDLQAPLYGIHSPNGASSPLTNPVVCLTVEQQRKLKNGPLWVATSDSLLVISSLKAFKPDTQKSRHTSAAIYCLWRDIAHKPLQCTCTNQEQMDTPPTWHQR